MTVYLGMLDPKDRVTAFTGGNYLANTLNWYFKLRSKNEQLLKYLEDERYMNINVGVGLYDMMVQNAEKRQDSKDINTILHALTCAPDSNKWSCGGYDRFFKLEKELQDYGINPEDMEFDSVEEIVRYLGYGAIYDRPGTCLLTHQPLADVEDKHIIEVPVWVPMLNTSEVPKVTILRSITVRKSWDCTHMGCDLVHNPHTDPARYSQKNRHENTCAITAQRWKDNASWQNPNAGDPGFPLIPVHPDVKQEISEIMLRMGSKNGLEPTEWSPSSLMPHCPSSS